MLLVLAIASICHKEAMTRHTLRQRLGEAKGSLLTVDDNIS